MFYITSNSVLPSAQYRPKKTDYLKELQFQNNDIAFLRAKGINICYKKINTLAIIQRNSTER